MANGTAGFDESASQADGDGHGHQDALSDVLGALRLRGGDVVRHTGGEAGTGISRYSEGQRIMHLVERTGTRLSVPGLDPVELAAGDMALLASGAPHTAHTIADGTRLTGELLMEPLLADPLLRVLPPAIVIRGNGEQTIWLTFGIRMILEELNAPAPGSQLMVARVLELLFIRALRCWAASPSRGARPGWLTAAMDPVLAPVLSAVNRAPERDWSVDDFARLSAMSRSALTSRFTAMLGEPPGAYALRRRLGHAAQLLLTSNEPVGRIGMAVGYTSEAGFSRAFSRVYGAAPRAWRVARLSENRLEGMNMVAH